MTTSTRHKRMLGGLAVIAALTVAGQLTGTGPLLLGGGEAHAVIGRPLTPMSYAGVARRTTRRAANDPCRDAVDAGIEIVQSDVDAIQVSAAHELLGNGFQLVRERDDVIAVPSHAPADV